MTIIWLLMIIIIAFDKLRNKLIWTFLRVCGAKTPNNMTLSRGARKLANRENLTLVWAEFSTISQAVAMM